MRLSGSCADGYHAVTLSVGADVTPAAHGHAGGRDSVVRYAQPNTIEGKHACLILLH